MPATTIEKVETTKTETAPPMTLVEMTSEPRHPTTLDELTTAQGPTTVDLGIMNEN